MSHKANPQYESLASFHVRIRLVIVPMAVYATQSIDEFTNDIIVELDV